MIVYNESKAEKSDEYLVISRYSKKNDWERLTVRHEKKKTNSANLENNIWNKINIYKELATNQKDCNCVLCGGFVSLASLRPLYQTDENNDNNK